jgi:WhiB family transcriptional regulator, redox-sensing transcriptional regulator
VGQVLARAGQVFLPPPPELPRAACRGLAAPLFVPDCEDGIETALAKKVCMSCPERQPCRQYGLEWPELRGVWGGLTYWDRARERRRLLAEAPEGRA